MDNASGNTNRPLISVVNLRVSYGEREVLHGISFDVHHGESLVILGGSGSGKSTLLRTLVGLEKPSGGEVWINNVNIAQATDAELDGIRKKMGVSFQGGALFGSMTVGENVALPLREHTRLAESTIEIMVRIKLDQVGLASFEDFMPSQLSGGMKKRAAVARALAMDPEILFFDEPSAGLDPVTSRRLDDLILALRDNLGATVVVVTHELASIFAIGNNSVFLDPESKTQIALGDPKILLEECPNPMVHSFLTRGDEPIERVAGGARG